MNKGENEIILSGYGNEKKGCWPAGKYHFEFYYDGRCIGTHEFTVN